MAQGGAGFLTIVTGRILTVLLSIVSIRISTDFLSPEQFGIYSLFLAIQLFCSMFLISPLDQHIYRNAHKWWDEQTLLARLSTYKRYMWLFSGVGALIAVGVSSPANLGDALLVAALMFGMVSAVSWYGMTIPMLNMLGFRAASVVLGVAGSFVALVASAAMAYMLSAKGYGWFAGQAIGFGSVALAASYLLRGKRPVVAGRLPLIDVGTIKSFAVPLAVATGFMWLQQSGYRLWVEHYWGLATLGYMAVAFLPSIQVFGVTETIGHQLLYPHFYRAIAAHEPAKSEAAMSDMLNIMGPTYIVVMGVAVVCIGAMMKLFIHEQYHVSLALAVLGAFIEGCRAIGNIFGRAAHVSRKTQTLSVPYAVGAMVQLMVIVTIGSVGSEVIWLGVCLVVGAFAMLTVMAIMMRREVRYTLDVGRWLLALGMLALFVTIGLSVPYPSDISRALMILVLGGFAGVASVAVLMWRNSALKRLLAVAL